MKGLQDRVIQDWHITKATRAPSVAEIVDIISWSQGWHNDVPNGQCLHAREITIAQSSICSCVCLPSILIPFLTWCNYVLKRPTITRNFLLYSHLTNQNTIWIATSINCLSSHRIFLHVIGGGNKKIAVLWFKTKPPFEHS